MSFVTTYILTVHDEDIENVAKLNEAIKQHLNWCPPDKVFRDMSWILRANADAFFAANLNHLLIDEMMKIVRTVEWNYSNLVNMQFKHENSRYWQSTKISFEI